MMKKIFTPIICFFLIISCFIPIYGKSTTGELYVQDQAGVISQSTESYITEQNRRIFKETGAQIAVVTLKTLDGQSIDELANTLFRDLKLGDSKRNNGILMLLAIEEQKLRIEVGYGMEGALPDVTADQIIREDMAPLLKEGDYDEAVTTGFNKILQKVEKEYGLQSYEPEERVNTKRIVMIVIGIGVLIILIAIDFIFFGGWFTPQILRLFLIFFSQGGRNDDDYGGGGSSGGGGASGGW